MKKNLIVLQEGTKDCGAACLLSIIRYYGGNVSLNRLIELSKTDKDGTNFYNLSKASNEMGLMTKCYKVDDLSKIKNITEPFIAQINNKNYNHFVVVYKIKDNKVIIMDPSTGKKVLDYFDFINIFTGYIMLFEKKKQLIIYEDKKILNKIIIDSLIKNKNIIYFLIILSIIITVLSCITSLYSKIVFDKIIDTTVNNLLVITILFSILSIVKIITNYIRNYLLIYLNQKLDISIILSTFSKVILLPFSYYKNKTTGEILSRINDLTKIKDFISRIIITLFLDLLTFITSFIIIYRINKIVLIYLLIIIIIYIFIIIIFTPVIRNISIKLQENTAKINNAIIESVSSFETIKGLSLEDMAIYKFSKCYSRSLNTIYKYQKVNNIIYILKDLVNDIGILLINYYCIKLIMNDKLTIGNYMTITFLIAYLLDPIKNIISILNEYHYIKNSIKRANNLFEVEDEKIYENHKLSIEGDIKINNLNYTYNDKNYILKNISFQINNNEKVLILGPSGVGKTTILKLLYKYYEVPRKMIYINNYDINDYSLSDIRKNLTYISQNEILYTDTIRNNILLGRNINEEEFLNICKITYVDEIINKRIQGYDYMLEENGANISGGQRQRIILARSLLKNSKIIMIDEGLSEIDNNLERKILKNIFEYYKDKTIIIISHKKENMDLYDRVLTITNDKVINLERRTI